MVVEGGTHHIFLVVDVVLTVVLSVVLGVVVLVVVLLVVLLVVCGLQVVGPDGLGLVNQSNGVGFVSVPEIKCKKKKRKKDRWNMIEK